MPSQTLNRLRTLEDAMATMATAVTRLSEEMRSFKDEMRSFKDEMRSFKDDMSSFKDDMSSFKDDMRSVTTGLHEEVRIFREEAARDRRDLNRQLGEIANAQGRLVEDIVAPSVPRILREVLALPADAPIAPSGPRLRLRHPTDRSRVRELDVVAGHDGVALVVEAKSVLAPEGIARFAASLPEARELLGPLAIREVIGAVATLHADPSIVAHATKLGLLVLAVGDELMERKNPPGFVPKRIG